MRIVLRLGLLWAMVSVSSCHCPVDVLVMYGMVLHTEWSEDNFPKQYPEWRPPAQWSVVVGRSHNASGVLWRLGETASDSIKMFVETGKAELLIRESIHQKRGILSEFFAPPVTQGVGSTEAKFFADASHSKVSMICRITPSPDWFIGLDSFDLCRGHKWVDKITVDLDPTDAGTDNGYTFTAPKWATDPRSTISAIRANYPDHPASSFFYPELDELPRIASATFFKLKEFFLTKDEDRGLKKDKEHMKKNISHKTETSILGSVNEFKKFDSEEETDVQKDRKKALFGSQMDAFSSKIETSKKRKIRKPKKNLYKSRSCRVSDWSEWGECSKMCGFGEQVRKRKIIHFSSKKGQPCPTLEESRRCRNFETCRNKTIGFFRWQ